MCSRKFSNDFYRRFASCRCAFWCICFWYRNQLPNSSSLRYVVGQLHFSKLLKDLLFHYLGKSSRVGAKYLGPHESVAGNFSQYNLDEHFVSLLIADASRHELWHLPKSGLFDSIVADRT